MKLEVILWSPHRTALTVGVFFRDHFSLKDDTLALTEITCRTVYGRSGFNARS